MDSACIFYHFRLTGLNDLEQSCQNEQQDRLHFGRKIELTDYMHIDHDIYILYYRMRDGVLG